MKLKVCILISAALVSVSAIAARSGLEFKVNGKNYVFRPDCIKEINYKGILNVDRVPLSPLIL